MRKEDKNFIFVITLGILGIVGAGIVVAHTDGAFCGNYSNVNVGQYPNGTAWLTYSSHTYIGYHIGEPINNGHYPNGTIWSPVYKSYSFECKGLP